MLQAQLAQLQMQLQVAETQTKIAELQSRTRLQDAKAQNEALEPRYKAMEIATKGIYEVQADQQDREFQRRMQFADRVLKARDISSNERIAAMQSKASVASEAVRAKAQSVTAKHDTVSSVLGEAVKATGHVAAARHNAVAKQITGRSAQLVS